MGGEYQKRFSGISYREWIRVCLRNSLTDIATLQDLGLVKVYTKKRGAHPDLADPVCLRKGSTIEASYLVSHLIYVEATFCI